MNAPRPAPAPDVRVPFLVAHWRYLVMLNFRVDPGLLEAYVPRGTRLDTWRGDAWLSLVGFRFLDTRIFGVPIPGFRDFPEVNLRFYVRPETDDRRAVVFLKEIVPRRAVAWTARALYNEPYVARTMMSEAPREPTQWPGPVAYGWRHEGRWNRFGITPKGRPLPVVRGSDAEFITEHYWGYTRQRDGGTIEYAVDHEPWLVWPTESIQYDVDAAAEYGPAVAAALGKPPDSAFLADGSAILVGRPRRLAVR